MPPLALFDLDGTLVDSVAVDAECFAAAVRAEFGFAMRTDWPSYRHSTDAGIAGEALGGHLGRPPWPDEVDRLRVCFCDLLAARIAAEPGRCREVPGAARLLAHLAAQGWAVAIATGGWSASAALKCRAAGLPPDLALFSSDLHPQREEIVAAAVAAHAAGGRPGAGRVVAFGDAAWDVRAAAALALPFVGVGRGAAAERLRRAGAGEVLADFRDLAAVERAMAAAGPPRGAG